MIMLRRGSIIPVPSEYAKALSHFKITQPYNTQKSRFHCGNGIFEYCSINKIKFEVVHGDGIAILDAELAQNLDALLKLLFLLELCTT